MQHVFYFSSSFPSTYTDVSSLTSSSFHFSYYYCYYYYQHFTYTPTLHKHKWILCNVYKGTRVEYNKTRHRQQANNIIHTCKKKEKERLNEIYSALSLLHIFHLGIFFFILFVFFSFLVACFSFIFRCVHFEWEIQFLSVWESERNGTAMRWKIRRSSSEKQENINWKKNILQ